MLVLEYVVLKSEYLKMQRGKQKKMKENFC